MVPALGVGSLFQTPLIALQAAMPISDMATSTAALGLIRTISGTIGISAGNAIYTSELRKRLPLIPGYSFDSSSVDGTNNVRGLVDIQPASLRQEVLHAYSESVSMIWIVCTPMLFVGLISVLFIRSYTLKRHVVRAGKGGPGPDGPGQPATAEMKDAELELSPVESEPPTRPGTADIEKQMAKAEKEKGKEGGSY